MGGRRCGGLARRRCWRLVDRGPTETEKISVADFGAQHSYSPGPRIGRHGLGLFALRFSLPLLRRVGGVLPTIGLAQGFKGAETRPNRGGGQRPESRSLGRTVCRLSIGWVFPLVSSYRPPLRTAGIKASASSALKILAHDENLAHCWSRPWRQCVGRAQRSAYRKVQSLYPCAPARLLSRRNPERRRWANHPPGTIPTRRPSLADYRREIPHSRCKNLSSASVMADSRSSPGERPDMRCSICSKAALRLMK